MTIYTNNKTGLPQPGLDASRDGRAFCLKVNDKTAIDTLGVLTDSGFLKAIEHGKRLVVASFHMALSTVSDWVTVEIGVTENEDGSGVFTALSPKFRMDTGEALAQIAPHQAAIEPPLAVTRDDGHALTARVQGNDSSAALTLALNGWEEDL